MKTDEQQGELRQLALEQAVEMYRVNTAINVVEEAEKIYAFLNKRTVQTKVENHNKIHVITKSLAELTPSQVKVLNAVCGMVKHGEPHVNATTVAKKMGKSQPVTSVHIKAITEKGYLDRDGNKWFPKYDASGTLFTMPVTKCPTKNSIGFKS